MYSIIANENGGLVSGTSSKNHTFSKITYKLQISKWNPGY
jgi:hypothetical protein